MKRAKVGQAKGKVGRSERRKGMGSTWKQIRGEPIGKVKKSMGSDGRKSMGSDGRKCRGEEGPVGEVRREKVGGKGRKCEGRKSRGSTVTESRKGEV